MKFDKSQVKDAQPVRLTVFPIWRKETCLLMNVLS